MSQARVVLVPDPTRDMVEIFFLRDIGHKQYGVCNAQRPELLWIDHKDEEKPEAFCALPNDLFEALMAEGNGIVRSTDATQAHLQDAIGVRDKLLDLVIRGWRHVDQPH